MYVWLLRLLGVTPNGGKTGKREASWALVTVALGLTSAAMYLGPEMVQAMTAVLVIVWPSAILAVAGAYKLEYDRTLLTPRKEAIHVRRATDDADPGKDRAE